MVVAHQADCTGASNGQFRKGEKVGAGGNGNATEISSSRLIRCRMRDFIFLIAVAVVICVLAAIVTSTE